MLWYCSSSTLYKGVFALVLALIVLEYIFGMISDSKNFVFNTAKPQQQHKENHNHHLLGSFLKGGKPIASNNTSNNITSHILISVLSNVNGSSGSKYLSNNNNTLLELFEISSSVVPDFDNITKVVNSTYLPLCPEEPPNLIGNVAIVKFPVPTVQQLEDRFSWLKPGGHWHPDSCKVLKKVAIVIPFRCRGEHLLLFLQHMHPILKRQQLDYTIFIIEQEGDGPFNRALLMNIGYKEALNRRKYDCFIFHDIDLLPENDKNLYTCPIQPRHMSVAVDSFKYKLPYNTIFGGVSAISTEHFQLLNGFSNSFWGWGGEDDDMSNRIRHHKLFISRYPPTIARYTMLTHKKDKPSPNRYNILKMGQQKFEDDGLNSLKYRIVQTKDNILYTWLLVAVDVPS